MPNMFFDSMSIRFFFMVLCFSWANPSLGSTCNIEAAYDYLSKAITESKFQCVCSKSVNFDPPFTQIPEENFSAMVLLDLLIDTDLNEWIKSILIQKLKHERGADGLFTFFTEKTLLPPDVDCMALGLTALTKAHAIDPEYARKALDVILLNVNNEGLIEVYVDSQRTGRIDPVVCANALYFIYLYGKEEEANLTEDFIYRILLTKTYENGTRYYPSEDTFLYMVSRLLDFPPLYEKFALLLHQHLKERRINSTNSSLDLSMRIICAKKLGLDAQAEKEKLDQLQQEDGGWPACAFFKRGRSADFFGSREITTAFALEALTDAKSKQ